MNRLTFLQAALASWEYGEPVEFKVLGPVAVTGDFGPVELGGPKPRAVLAVLLANLGRWVSTDRLVDEVWGNDPPASAVNTLQSYLSRLRHSLGAERLASGPAGYRLAGEGAGFDSAEFERLIDETVGEQDPAVRRRLLAEALSLWRGDPYQGVADTPTVIAERTRLRERRLVAVERRVAADLDMGDHQLLISELERLVDQNPLREGLWAQLMLASYRSGRQADALAAYRRLRNLLGQELGIEPGPEIRRLEEQILLQDPALHLVDLIRQQPGSSHRPVSGTVTFLFTDIEESTRLWEEHPHAMAAALAEHDRILTSVIEAAGGYLFSSAGDSHAAAFQRAGQAVQAAIYGQLALKDVTVDGLPLPVRMAIHTGEALERDGDYFGPVLNRTGRLRDAAHGGQILVSHAVEVLVGGELSDQAGLLDLGEHRLRDLTRLERIFQVTHPDLPATFPPLHTLDATRHNLPIQLTSFVGRNRELAEVQGLLEGFRLVTLTGAGGCGKTRVAIQAAASLLETFPDGVWFVDLAPLTDPELVTGTTARSLGLTEPRNGRTLDILLAFVRFKEMLLVLDNCEHLLGEVARLTAELLQVAPQLRVLTTTRQPLGLLGETVWPLPPLRIPAEDTPTGDLHKFESVRLFQERAESARPGFRVTDANGGAVRRICRRLDGIPLALELVTAKLRVLSTGEIAARLDDSFTVLGSAGADVPPHQRTLEATLDWSFDLLTQQEQTLLIRLSVFAGGWTLATAEHVCSGDGIDSSKVLELIFGLADKSLVVVGNGLLGTRYRLLEPLREYALGKLVEAGEEAAFRSRHAGHFAWLAEEAFHQLIGPEEVQWLDRLEDEADNLRAALAWHLEAGETQQGQLMAGALYRFWVRSLRNMEARTWLERMLNADRTVGVARARVLLGLSAVSDFSVVERASFLDEALEVYRGFGPEYELEIALNNRAVWASSQGDWQLATSLYEEGLDRARQLGDDGLIGRFAGNLSDVKADWEGDLQAAGPLAEEAAAAARKFGSLDGIHSALRSLAKVAMHRGDFPAAIFALKEALEIERQPGARVSYLGEALVGLADAAFRAGSLEEALDYLSQHRAQMEALGYGEPESRLLVGTSSLFLWGELEVARSHHRLGVVLMAAVAAAHKNEVLAPGDATRWDIAISDARRVLGEESFAAAWNEGSAMTVSQALGYALQNPES